MSQPPQAAPPSAPPPGSPAQPGKGFDDATLAAGRPWSAFLYALALLAAFAADIGTIRQALGFAMPDSDQRTIDLIVIGFACVAVFLCHVSGVMLRERVAGTTWIRGRAAWFCIIVWAALGAATYLARVRSVDTDAGGDSGVEVEVPAPPPPDLAAPAPDYLDVNASMFLVLYVGTGLLAMTGAYLTHNPARSAFVRTKWALVWANRRLARAVLRSEVARGTQRLYELTRKSAAAVLQQEQARRLAFAEALKQHARLAIAQHAQDPAVTDALFDAHDGHAHDGHAHDGRADDPAGGPRPTDQPPES